MGKKHEKNKLGLMALVGETAKMAKNMVVLDKTEAALEKELEKEIKNQPTTKFGKYRKTGQHLLHSKQVLLMVVILNIIDCLLVLGELMLDIKYVTVLMMVVILNIIDCLLVLGELMLDIKYVTDLLTKEYARSEEFVGEMKGLYPVRLDYLYHDDIALLEEEILHATIHWEDHSHSHGLPSNDTNRSPFGNATDSGLHSEHHLVRRASSGGGGGGNVTHAGHHHAAHSLEEDIAHGLHKASISILGILVVETIFKIVCLGKELLDHKLECFDGFIVFVSFVVDLVLLKGLQQFKVQEFVLILSFLVPWRVVRVVNSLVVAIMDHEHFRLKLLYKQKKKTSAELKDAQVEIKGLQACIKELENMCSEAGVSESHVNAKLNMFRMVNAKNNPMGAISSFAMGGDAMNKPFPIAPPKNVSVVMVESEKPCNGSPASKALNGHLAADTLEVAGAFSSIVSVDKESDPLNKAIRDTVTEARSRSSSQNEPGQTAETEQARLKYLAEQSAGFIATISDDNRTRQTDEKGETNKGYLKDDNSTGKIPNDENTENDRPHVSSTDEISEL